MVASPFPSDGNDPLVKAASIWCASFFAPTACVRCLIELGDAAVRIAQEILANSVTFLGTCANVATLMECRESSCPSLSLLVPNDLQHPENDHQRTERFVELFTAHGRQVYVFIRTQLPSAADVEEVWQSTNLLLWKKFGEFQEGTNFRAWAFQIARYEVLNHRARRGNTTLQFSDELWERLATDEQANADQTDARLAALRFCLQKLSTVDRELIEQRFASEASGETVAAALGRTPRYVYKAVSRIRKVLVDCIERHVLREEHPQ
jgi:RNA polymerase sigma-70 factor (ECF subfamily)